MLTTHRGGWDATFADLASVPVPEPTDSYCPVSYARLCEEVKLHIPRFGLTVEDERFALARDGNQMFGVLTCRNGHVADWGLAIGLRSSYDRSLAVELVAGSRVFVCDNLAFHGETQVSRMHTVNVFRDLPDLIYKMLAAVSSMKDRMTAEIDQMKDTPLTPYLADHILMQAVRKGALPASRLPKVDEAWENTVSPKDEPRVLLDRTAWSLFNAFTEIARQQPPWLQMDNTLRLTQVFRDALSQAGSAFDRRAS